MIDAIHEAKLGRKPMLLKLQKECKREENGKCKGIEGQSTLIGANMMTS
jgi:hypothetical protein